MAGNVWEWTCTLYDRLRFPYPYHPGDGREVRDRRAILLHEMMVEGDIQLVIRGGSRNYEAWYARAATRASLHPASPDTGEWDLGARLVIAPAIKSADHLPGALMGTGSEAEPH